MKQATKQKKWFSVGPPAMILLGMMSLTVAASAEENGYWTTRVDGQGNIVQIFVYTEPVEWEIVDDPSLGRCGMDSAPPAAEPETVAAVEMAELHLAAPAEEAGAVPAAGIAQADSEAGVPSSEQPLYLIAAVGLVALAGLGYALYKAV